MGSLIAPSHRCAGLSRGCSTTSTSASSSASSRSQHRARRCLRPPPRTLRYADSPRPPHSQTSSGSSLPAPIHNSSGTTKRSHYSKFPLSPVAELLTGSGISRQSLWQVLCLPEFADLGPAQAFCSSRCAARHSWRRDPIFAATTGGAWTGFGSSSAR